MEQAEGADKDALLQQASNIWQMLDEMADHDPAAYRKFIEKQKIEQQNYKESMKPPEPHMCILSVLQENIGVCKKGEAIYVNFCEWNRLPSPKDEESPIPCAGSNLYQITDDKGEKHHAVSVAFNPKVLEDFGVDSVLHQERGMLINLALDFLQDVREIKLSRSYSLFPKKLKCKGDKKSVQNALMDMSNIKAEKEQFEKELGELEKSFGPMAGGKDLLINQLSNISVKEPNGASSQNQNRHHIKLPGEKDVPNVPKKGLIEEIGGTQAKVTTPEYSIVELEQNDTKPCRVQLKVMLPGVSSVQDCSLDISEDDVHLEVEGKYALTVKLPQKIQEESSSAKFSKKTSTLNITMPVNNNL